MPTVLPVTKTKCWGRTKLIMNITSVDDCDVNKSIPNVINICFIGGAANGRNRERTSLHHDRRPSMRLHLESRQGGCRGPGPERANILHRVVRPPRGRTSPGPEDQTEGCLQPLRSVPEEHHPGTLDHRQGSAQAQRQKVRAMAVRHGHGALLRPHDLFPPQRVGHQRLLGDRLLLLPSVRGLADRDSTRGPAAAEH